MNANQNLFNEAHQIARETRNAFATYREAFAAALRQFWTAAKEAEKAAREAEKAARIEAELRRSAVYNRPKVIKAAREVRAILIAKGCNPETEKEIQWVLILHPLNVTEREAARELANFRI